MKSVYAAIIGLLFGSAVALGSLEACHPGPIPPNTPADVLNALACVVPALISGGTAIDACAISSTPALVADALQILIHSTFGAAHPDLIPRMTERMGAYRSMAAAK